MPADHSPNILTPSQGDLIHLTAIGVRFMISAHDSGGNFALVEHPIPPRALGAPLHRHHNEDEYSYVLEGRIGAQLGDEIVFANVGDLIFKPRNQWHTFWNAGDSPARILEIISPAGFEQYFREMGALPPDATPADRAAIAARYSLDVDPSSIPRLIAEHGLRFGASGPSDSQPTDPS
jgi:mannose-6-phosphate isomerase-like protein (cupin superfamily)